MNARLLGPMLNIAVDAAHEMVTFTCLTCPNPAFFLLALGCQINIVASYLPCSLMPSLMPAITIILLIFIALCRQATAAPCVSNNAFGALNLNCNNAAVLPQCNRQYFVVAGDTLTTIAQRMCVPLHSVQQCNPQIPNFDVIMVGQVLRLP